MRHPKAAMWFHCIPSPLKRKLMITVKTVSDTTSCITLSWTRLKGPPLMFDYSKKASPQEKRITRMSGHPSEIFISWSFRCPYQANVIKMLDTISSNTVQTPCMI